MNNLKESRLYTYVHAEAGLLHLICIGDKGSQQSDIQTASRYVAELRKKHSKQE
jgi:putative component of toxin-antitoxin plasmid stabilization module